VLYSALYVRWIRRRIVLAPLRASDGRIRNLALGARHVGPGISGVMRPTPDGDYSCSCPYVHISSLTRASSHNCKKGDRLCSYNGAYRRISFIFLEFVLTGNSTLAGKKTQPARIRTFRPLSSPECPIFSSSGASAAPSCYKSRDRSAIAEF
jgi:hypothetical protein